jgi:hypothetical protein
LSTESFQIGIASFDGRFMFNVAHTFHPPS